MYLHIELQVFKGIPVIRLQRSDCCQAARRTEHPARVVVDVIQVPRVDQLIGSLSASVCKAFKVESARHSLGVEPKPGVL